MFLNPIKDFIVAHAAQSANESGNSAGLHRDVCAYQIVFSGKNVSQLASQIDFFLNTVPLSSLFSTHTDTWI